MYVPESCRLPIDLSHHPVSARAEVPHNSREEGSSSTFGKDGFCLLISWRKRATTGDSWHNPPWISTCPTSNPSSYSFWIYVLKNYPVRIKYLRRGGVYISYEDEVAQLYPAGVLPQLAGQEEVGEREQRCRYPGYLPRPPQELDCWDSGSTSLQLLPLSKGHFSIYKSYIFQLLVVSFFLCLFFHFLQLLIYIQIYHWNFHTFCPLCCLFDSFCCLSFLYGHPLHRWFGGSPFNHFVESREDFGTVSLMLLHQSARGLNSSLSPSSSLYVL